MRPSLATIQDSDIFEIGYGTRKNTEFRQVDIRRIWNSPEDSFGVATASPIVEHFANTDFVFSEVNRVLRKAGRFCTGEFHPLNPDYAIEEIEGKWVIISNA